MEEPREAPRTKLPTDLDAEQPFLSLAEVKLSLRQMLTIVGAFALWLTFFKVTTWILPVSGILAGLLWSWIIIAGFFFALVPKDGVPYEEYLGRKVAFLMSERHYILKDPEHDGRTIEDADWEELEMAPYSAWSNER